MSDGVYSRYIIIYNVLYSKYVSFVNLVCEYFRIFPG